MFQAACIASYPFCYWCFRHLLSHPVITGCGMTSCSTLIRLVIIMQALSRSVNHSADNLPQTSRKKTGSFCNQSETETANWNWLDAERTTGGYRWRLSRRLIEPEMWASGHPNCAGDCAVCSKADGSLTDRSAISSGCNTLCVFDMSNEVTYMKLLSKLSLVYEPDRAGLQLTIIKYTQEKRILQEHALIQNLSSDLQKLESSITLLS